jgi:hypothetical protein
MTKIIRESIAHRDAECIMYDDIVIHKLIHLSDIILYNKR